MHQPEYASSHSTVADCSIAMSSNVRSTLDEVLAYHNDQILHRFIRQYDMTLAEADGIFTSTKQCCGSTISPMCHR